MSCYVYNSMISHLNGMKFTVEVALHATELDHHKAIPKIKLVKLVFHFVFYCAL